MAVLVVFWLIGSAAVHADDPITIYYVERVPYFYSDADGRLQGLVAEPVLLAFEKAEIPYIIQAMPARRLLIYLEEGRPNICAMGWYKNPEREAFAKFSEPVYQNRTRIALARKDNDRVQSGKTLEEIFRTPGLTLLVKDGYSYGLFIDSAIETFEPQVYRTTRESDRMIEMIHRGSYDYFFLSEEEADALIPMAGFAKEDFKYVRVRDVPVGLKRYIMFSRQVDDRIIERINRAIRDIVKFDPS